MTVTATFGSRSRLRAFFLPLAVLKRTSSPSRSTHSSVIWGEPSGLMVAREARTGRAISSRAFSDRTSAMGRSFFDNDAPMLLGSYGTARGCGAVGAEKAGPQVPDAPERG